MSYKIKGELANNNYFQLKVRIAMIVTAKNIINSAKEQIFVLVNQNNNNSTVKKYNWTFTVTGGL